MTTSHSSKLAGLKDYVWQRELRPSLPSQLVAAPGEDVNTLGYTTIQSWGHWASQKIRRNTTDVATIDEVHLFPGWATTQLHRHSPDKPENNFDVVLHVSGFATSRRTSEFPTRSQRAFLKLARSFAAIPKPQTVAHPTDTELRDFSEAPRFPPRPDEISDGYEAENLDAHFRNSRNHNQDMDDTPIAPQSALADAIPVELARLHENLESRLKLFWVSSLPSRRIQVFVFLHSSDPKCYWHSLECRPLLTQEMFTGPDGQFSGTLRIDWNDIRTHLANLHIISNGKRVEHELLVEARITNVERMPELHETPTSTVHIPITHSTIRVISDIDDTVKVSRVMDGARAIFKQVFVKDLEDTVIPEMGEWYGTMWEHGVRFHYVSNSPFELLPTINQFIRISNLPLGSIHLRSYAGRSLFNGLLSAPATRKRGNVIEVLDHFPESQFLLIGDSGEQDLELYSSLAAERPDQIAGVFIRDVNAVILEDPSGMKAYLGSSNSPMRFRSKGTLPIPGSLPLRTVPKRTASETDAPLARLDAIHIPRPTKKGSLPPTSFSFELSRDTKPLSRVSEVSSSSIASTGSSPSSSLRSTHQVRPITEGEKKRWDLQYRVNKARLLMPSHIVLRVFEHPKECVEAEQIIQRLTNVN